ncbi:apolipoprotein N-acyltransferase [Massilia yuzhufengensis]|uniref:Apolipoprotein N-acyltransferase n=1 Tax=Massilia yuzhufengensis TaxID=1164594 RepID=A0A1I1TZU6_9BURK|nr:apolipoprotein N-acyltransferase [Massilia yuzhufengensis]SFD64151.1 Apolipoprotein N-acyltransferase [Massilia yuzhufengensis]
MLRRRTPAAAAKPAAAVTRPSPLALVLAALAGALSLFSFEPFGWWPLQFLSLAYFFYQVGVKNSPRYGLLLGWAFGFGWSVAGMHWLYIAITRFGGLPAILGAIAIALLGVYMGLFGAFAGGAASWVRRKWSLPVPAFVLLVLPVAWGLSEWLRGWVFTGFPWASAGYAHNVSPLGGYAPLVGVYGVGMLAAVCAGCLAMLTQPKRRWRHIAILVAVLAAGFGLKQIAWTHEVGQPLTVRLLQGDVKQDQKFDTAYLLDILNRYQAMITAAPSDLIATPETAIPVTPQQLPGGYLAELNDFARRTGSHLMIGIPTADSPTQYSNSVIATGPASAPGAPAYRYDKHHLVPFGEFIPPGFRWFTDLMHIPLGDQTRGKALQAPFPVKDQLVLPNICYEDAFGEEIAAQLRNAPKPATLLLNVSNLAWYGESVAIPQHLQISQMRSIETGRPMLRSTNNGATAIIDGRGRIVQQLPFYERGVLAASVRGMAGFTPYIRFGNGGFLLLGAFMLLGAWFAGRRLRNRKSNA